MIRLLILLLLPFWVFCQNLSVPENLGFYGGFSWDFHLTEYQGRKLILTCQSGGNQIYYAFLDQGEHPKNINWQKLPATELGQTSEIEAHRIHFHKSSGTIFWSQGFTRVLSATLNDDFAKPHDDIADIWIEGDTLISLRLTSNPGPQIHRHYLNQKAELSLIGVDTIRAYNVGYELYLDPKTKQIVLFGRDSVFLSDKPYYHPGLGLNFSRRAHQFPFDTLLQDPVFHIKENGEWLLLQSQNYYSNWFGSDDSIALDRIISRSSDQGLSWDYQFVDGEWPIAFLLPPNISSASIRGHEIISAGSLYRIDSEDWKTIGHKNRKNGLFVYDGTSAIDPHDPSIAFHAGSYGPVVSTAFGDSIYLLNEGIDAAHLCDMKFYPESRSMIVASEQRIGLLQACGLPQERWLWIPSRAEFIDREIKVSFDEDRNRVYVAGEKVMAYDIDTKEWKLILDPVQILNSPIDDSHGIFDVSVNPYDSKMVVCNMKNDANNRSFIMLSRDAGESWDSLSIPGNSYYWFSRAEWAVGDDHFELQFSHSNSWPHLSHSNQIYKYLIWEDSLAVSSDSLIDLEQGMNIIQLKSSNSPNIPDVSIADLNDWQAGDFQLLLRRGNRWDSIWGPRIPNCYICFNYPRSVVADEKYAYVGAGHHLYRFDIRLGREKFLDEIYTYPRLENIREMRIIDNQLYVQGAYGLYRHELAYLEEPNHISENWSLYPNPSNGILNLQPPSPFSVYDLKGVKVFQSKDIQYRIDLSNLQPGIYLIKTPNYAAKLWRKL
ncbi:MAG: T9SS type A sorting domain-containing protein [Croceimicrobium sp.]